MNVVVGAVVDASVYVFAAEDIVVSASLDVIFNANLFNLALFFSMNNALLSLCRAALVGCV